MKITRISTAVLEANFDWTLIKLETDEKITGYGEAFLGPGLVPVIREFSALLVGEDPTNLERLLRRLRASCVHASPGLTFHAMAGLETALLDVIGKRHNMPVWQLLGGKYRDRVRIYADCHGGDALESISCLLVPRTPLWAQTGQAHHKAQVSIKHHGWDAASGEHASPEAYAARAQEMAARGFSLLKFDVDVPTPYESDEYNRDLNPPDIEYAFELVSAVRNAVGPQVGLAVDCHWNYGVRTAVELGRALERSRLAWLEDPVPPDNIRALAEVQKNTTTTIATGENNYLRTEFDRLITEAGLRIIAPDLQKVGIWEGKKLADLADMHYVNLTIHNISGPIGTMAGVHLSASVPNFMALEWHAASVPFFDDLVAGNSAPLVQKGSIVVPNSPGLGITLNEDVAYRYRRTDEKFFE